MLAIREVKLKLGFYINQLRETLTEEKQNQARFVPLISSHIEVPREVFLM